METPKVGDRVRLRTTVKTGQLVTAPWKPGREDGSVHEVTKVTTKGFVYLSGKQALRFKLAADGHWRWAPLLEDKAPDTHKWLEPAP